MFPRIAAARKGDWKIIRNRPGAPAELYNLRSDPSETTNAATANPAVLAQMEAALKQAHTEPRGVPGNMRLQRGRIRQPDEIAGRRFLEIDHAAAGKRSTNP